MFCFQVQPSKHDQTYNAIVRVLGSFDTVQPFVQTQVVGVGEKTSTQQVAGKNFNYNKAEVPNGAVRNVQVKKGSNERPGHDRKHSGVKFKTERDQDDSETKCELPLSEMKIPHLYKSSNESKGGHDAKISITSGYRGRVEPAREERAISISPVKPSSHTLSKDVHNKRDSQTVSPGVKNRPPAKPPATPPLKEITTSITSQLESPAPKAPSRPHPSTPLKETPPPNGVVKRLGKDETKNRLPKLTIPLEVGDSPLFVFTALMYTFVNS